jgi:hypothetical protein
MSPKDYSDEELAKYRTTKDKNSQLRVNAVLYILRNMDTLKQIAKYPESVH